MIKLFSLLLLFSQASFATSITDNIKNTLCALSKTKIMCIIEGIKDISPSVKVDSFTRIYGQSKNLFLVSDNSDWVQMWPNTQRKEELLLIEKDGEAFIEVTSNLIEDKSLKEIAMAPIKKLGLLQKDTHLIEVDFWPFDQKGIIYFICYETNKKTNECIFSAVADLPNTQVTIFSITNYNEKLLKNISGIITSLNVPDRISQNLSVPNKQINKD